MAQLFKKNLKSWRCQFFTLDSRNEFEILDITIIASIPLSFWNHVFLVFWVSMTFDPLSLLIYQQSFLRHWDVPLEWKSYNEYSELESVEQFQSLTNDVEDILNGIQLTAIVWHNSKTWIWFLTFFPSSEFNMLSMIFCQMMWFLGKNHCKVIDKNKKEATYQKDVRAKGCTKLLIKAEPFTLLVFIIWSTKHFPWDRLPNHIQFDIQNWPRV